MCRGLELLLSLVVERKINLRIKLNWKRNEENEDEERSRYYFFLFQGEKKYLDALPLRSFLFLFL